jgi:LysR family transcriptional regulator, hca operon transcriptional activator
MDLRYLRYFVMVAEKLSFTRAAERLGTSQPGLSVQIRRLETELGVELFNRDNRGVTLSRAGEVFFDRARRILADMERSVAVTRLAAQGETVELSIGHDPSAEFRIFPWILPRFRKRWPNIHLKFYSLKSFQVLEKLRANEVDIGFVFLPTPEAGYDVTPLITITLIVAVPAEHTLAGKKGAVTLKELSGEPLIMFAGSADPALYREIELLFMEAGATLNVVIEAGSVTSGINFVSMGVGCCLLGDYTQRVPWAGVVYKQLELGGFAKTLAIMKSQASPKAVETFYNWTCGDEMIALYSGAVRPAESPSVYARSMDRVREAG